MNEIKTSIVTTTRKTHQLTIDAAMIRTMLDNTGITIPANASIQFHVPGGGDWSNMAVDIDKNNPVHVEWTEEQTS